jgi:hypothetical protein
MTNKLTLWDIVKARVPKEKVIKGNVEAGLEYNFEEKEVYNSYLSDLQQSLSKVEIDVLRLKDVMNTKCQKCKSVREGCHFICSILANEIIQHLAGLGEEKR